MACLRSHAAGAFHPKLPPKPPNEPQIFPKIEIKWVKSGTCVSGPLSGRKYILIGLLEEVTEFHLEAQAGACGAMVARLTPDQKVAGSIPSGLSDGIKVAE